MRPVLFEGHDVVLGAPEGWDEKTHGPCDGLPIMRENGSCISMWQLTNKERAAIAAGAHVRLHVVSGATQPPVMLEVGPPDHTRMARFMPVIIMGDGSVSGTKIIDELTMMEMTNVRSFTTYASAEGAMEARLEVSGDALLLGEHRPDASGFKCMAVVMAGDVDYG